MDPPRCLLHKISNPKVKLIQQKKKSVALAQGQSSDKFDTRSVNDSKICDSSQPYYGPIFINGTYAGDRTKPPESPEPKKRSPLKTRCVSGEKNQHLVCPKAPTSRIKKISSEKTPRKLKIKLRM